MPEQVDTPNVPLPEQNAWRIERTRDWLRNLRGEFESQKELCKERHATAKEAIEDLHEDFREFVGEFKVMRKELFNGSGVIHQLRSDITNLQHWTGTHDMLAQKPPRKLTEEEHEELDDRVASGNRRPRGFWAFLRSLPPAGWLIVALLILTLVVILLLVVVLMVLITDASEWEKFVQILGLIPGLGGSP